MKSSNYRFTLDMHSLQSQTSLPALLGDTSRTLYINFTDGNEPYYIEDGCLAKISITRPTGTHLEEFCEIKNNTTVIYQFSQNINTCAVEGIHECDVTLYGPDGEKITSPRFSMIVSEAVIRSDDINISDEDKTLIGDMIAAEASRQEAEKGRVNTEASRVIAELGRESAEKARTANFKNLVDSFSYLNPTVTITTIPGGHRVTITDINTSQSFDVMDGNSADCKLPSVSTADEGKFLRVIGGVWTASEVKSAEGGGF